jgi:photosystem II stability/assembly factor-like uncharacterized protein
MNAALVRQLHARDCAMNLYLPSGQCRDLSDLTRGWDRQTIISYAEPTEYDRGDLMSFDDTPERVTSIALAAEDIYEIAPLNFDEGVTESGAGASGFVSIAFADLRGCGECGYDNDGSDWIYAVTSGDTASDPTPNGPSLYYSTNAGDSWTEITSATLGSGIAQAAAVAVIGDYVVILGKNFTTAGFWYAQLSKSGVPGTWTSVTTGFSTSTMNAMYVLSPREIFMAGNAGKLYKSNDFRAGVTTDLTITGVTTVWAEIHGQGDTIVVVGATGVIYRSYDRGVTWSSVTGPVATALTGLAVMDKYHWWIGTTGAGVYYTADGGVSWTQKNVAGLSGIVYHILFATAEIGYLGATNLAMTTDGGETWTTGTSRVLNVPTVGQFYSIGAPTFARKEVAAAIVCYGGISADNLDGVLFTAKSQIF